MSALPDATEQKLRALEQLAEDQAALAGAVKAAIERLHVDAANANRRAKAAVGQPDDEAVAHAGLAKVRKQLDEAQAEMIARAAAASAAQRTLTQVMSWLKALPFNAVLQAVDFEP